MTKQLLEQAVALAKDLRESLDDWAGYAPDYSKDKHKFDEEVSAYDQRIKALETALEKAKELL